MNVRRLFSLLALLLACSMTVASADEPEAPSTPAPLPSREELEAKFEQTMSGATLVGTFTVTGQTDKKLNEEKYTIVSVKKLKGDLWLFKSRIQYGTHDLTVPLALEVKWAGDTAVITLTDMPVPGFGTFTSRVLVYRDEYAGTWSGGDHGGHLFGRIVKASDEKSADSKASENDVKKAADVAPASKP